MLMCSACSMSSVSAAHHRANTHSPAPKTTRGNKTDSCKMHHNEQRRVCLHMWWLDTACQIRTSPPLIVNGVCLCQQLSGGRDRVCVWERGNFISKFYLTCLCTVCFMFHKNRMKCHDSKYYSFCFFTTGGSISDFENFQQTSSWCRGKCTWVGYQRMSL